MQYLFTAISKLPFLLRKGSFLLIISMLLVHTACDSKGTVVNDAVFTENGSVFIAGLFNNKPSFFYISNGVLCNADPAPEIMDRMGKIIKITKLTTDVCAVITKKNGIFLLPLQKKLNIIAHLPVSKSTLLNSDIRHIEYYNYNNSRKLYVIYNAPAGAGMTEVILGPGWNIESCNQFTKESSDIRSNKIIQVEPDAQGYVWINYSFKDKLGVSRLSPDGSWRHYDMNNSDIPDKYVYLIKAEKPGMGLNKDNVWFASESGLTRMQHRPEKKDMEEREKWKLYGERKKATSLISSAFGVRGLFSDIIFNIKNIYIGEKYILLSNFDGVYIFNGRDTNRFKPNNLGGQDGTRIIDILHRKHSILVKTAPKATDVEHINGFLLMNLNKREWVDLDIWKIKKEFPQRILSLPVNESTDLVIFIYYPNKTAFAYIDFNTSSIKPFEIPQYKSIDEIPLCQNLTDKDSSSNAGKVLSGKAAENSQ